MIASFFILKLKSPGASKLELAESFDPSLVSGFFYFTKKGGDRMKVGDIVKVLDAIEAGRTGDVCEVLDFDFNSNVRVRFADGEIRYYRERQLEYVRDKIGGEIKWKRE